MDNPMTHAAYRFFTVNGECETARWDGDKLNRLTETLVWVIPGSKHYHDHNPAQADYADRIRGTSCGSPEEFAGAVQMTVIAAVLKGFSFCGHCAQWNTEKLPHIYGKVIAGAPVYRVSFTGLDAVNPDKNAPYHTQVMRLCQWEGIEGVQEVKPGVYLVPDAAMTEFANKVIHGFMYDNRYSKRRGYGLMKFSWRVAPATK